MTTNKSIHPVEDLQRQFELLRMEYEYEKEQYHQKSERIGIYKKIQLGVCWYPVTTGKSYYNSLNQLTIDLERREDTGIEHTFEYGRPVCFFTTDITGAPRYFHFSATISYVRENRMVVALPNPSALSDIEGKPDLGVQLYFDETSYKAMFAALSEIIQAKDNRLAGLRDILRGRSAAGFRELYPVRFPWLNRTQEEAVNHVLGAKDVAIVHGPPGTGKTTTLVEAIYETLHRENQVMVCAQSNMAVDWISEKLADRGIPVLRIGNPTRVNDKMLSFTYERRFESHPDYSELWSIRKAIRQGKAHHRNPDSLQQLRIRAAELEIKIKEELFNEARVIACTLVGAANRILEKHHFTSLFIDEAAQALEAACWIAIGKADRVILAGDYHQLPPTIKCIEAARGGLDRTLMQKVAHHQPAVVSLLKIQYRMHDDIMRFSSGWFYQGELESAPEVKNRGILSFDTPIVWYDTAACEFEEEQPADSLSRANKQEAEFLVSQLQGYIEKITPQRVLDEQIDFGLISPYKAQVYYLRSLIKKNNFFKPFHKLITIHTVDGFQGQERDVILISLVRANEDGRIGFLHDLRRMNVAITRARMKLMILGNAATLIRHPFYKKLYEYIAATGEIYTVQPPKISS